MKFWYYTLEVVDNHKTMRCNCICHNEFITSFPLVSVLEFNKKRYNVTISSLFITYIQEINETEYENLNEQFNNGE